MKGILKDTLILFVITLVAGLLLGGVYKLTKDPIAKQDKISKDKANKAVFEEADTFENDDTADLDNVLKNTEYSSTVTVDEVQKALKNGETLGYVITVTTNEGYGGNITIVTGIKNDGTVNGISILSISETAGLGMNATKEKFYGQFAGKNVEKYVYTKEGAKEENEIDAISSATITTNAVTNSVNAAKQVYKALDKDGGAK